MNKLLHIKLFILISMFCIQSAITIAQPLGNEWIDYKQQYFKIKIWQEGIYRISYKTLENAGVQVSNIDPRYFQLFNQGTEQPIFVNGEANGSLDQGDYIEFYGKPNDGYADKYLYKTPADQANPEYSLINDTAVYFLTINDFLNNKRINNIRDNNFNAFTPVDYFFRNERQNFTSTYYNGETTGSVNDPDYTAGEGWFDTGFNLSTATEKPIPINNVYQSGIPALIDIMLIGASNYAYMNPDHHVRISFPGTTIDTIFEGYKLIPISQSINTNDLTSPFTKFTFSTIDNLNSDADNNTIAYISVKYPHLPDFESTSKYKFYLPSTTQSKSLLTFSNVNVASSDSVFIFDLDGQNRILSYKNGSSFNAIIPSNSQEKKCFLTTGAEIKEVSNFTPVNSNMASFAKFTNYAGGSNANSTYIIITHSSLLQSAAKYKAFRTSTGYKTLLVDAEELYDQYAYGTTKHPIAIKNFLHYCYQTFTTKPKFVFFIGKGYRAGDNGGDYYRNSPYMSANTYIPAIGTPPSDIMYSTGFSNNLYQPALATGRLSARTNADVELYLNKIKDYELAQKQPQEWMKNVLHFSGGTSRYEQALLQGFVSSYEKIIKDTLFGAKVTSFYKVSSAPFVVNRSDSLRQIINNGVSLMTFFGHGAGIGFDQSIDNPAEYRNFQKYFFILANSCYAGDLFINTRTSSEAFVLIENKGAVGYLSSIAKADAYLLHVFSTEFYKQITYKNYNQPVGICIQQTIKNIQYNDLSFKDMIYALILHGDPALKINSSDKPDLMIDSKGAYFSPTIVNVEDKRFSIKIISTNIGKAISDSMYIQVIRKMPNNQKHDTLILVPVTHYKDTITINYDLNLVDLGFNTFTIILDAFNEIDESSELNNTYTFTLLVQSSDITPIYPYEFAVIPKSTTTLTGYTFYSSTTPHNYIFEIDTTDNFINPIARQSFIHTNGLLNWTPPVVFTDSTVYYWRVSIDSIYKGKYHWKESSFQYIKGKYGWGQADFEQFKKNNFTFLFYNKPKQRFDFTNNIINITAQDKVLIKPEDLTEIWLRSNGVTLNTGNCAGGSFDAIEFAVFNPTTGKPWVSVNPDYDQRIYFGQYGDWHCKGYDVSAFDFFTEGSESFSWAPFTEAEWFARIKHFIDTIPIGYKVFVMSHKTFNNNQFPDDLIHAFKQIGCTNIRKARTDAPYICFGTKEIDTLHVGHEALGESSQSVIRLSDTIISTWNEGDMQSTIIGPASKWGSLHWRFSSKDKPLDNVRVEVSGINNNGESKVLIPNLKPFKDIDIYNLDTLIDVNSYPFLQLNAFFIDDTNRTPPNWKRWQVLYEGVPETAIDPTTQYYVNKDSLKEGDTYIFSVATKNISEYNFKDSLLFHYWLIDENQNYIDLGYKRTRLHPAGDILIDTIKVNTRGLSGMVNLWLEVNPINNKTGLYDQQEQYHFNNIISTLFYVEKDITNPILDLTFDGIHILNGDIVSAKPEILITLKDENKFLAMTDTTSFRLYLKRPSSTEITQLYFGDPINNLVFIPASLPTNKCQIKFNPIFTVDGNYTLYVQASDKSGNFSAIGKSELFDTYDYNITFKIITKSSITQILNWPNPFSTSTRFVFILTGSEIPTYFKIQIMTVTGKVVREITQDELGPIHIGRNITEFAWDATDTYGDRLANGVYLYHIVTSIQGKKIDNYATEADQYFKKEFGKMYIIR